MSKTWLNSRLNINELLQKFTSEQLITIPEILNPDSAAKIRDALRGNVTWTLCYLENGMPHGVSASVWEASSKEMREEFIRKVYAGAETGFQFLYDHFALSDAVEQGNDIAKPLSDFVGFLKSDEFIGFIRNVTQNTDGVRVDAHAARYGRGHFLNKHNDSHDPLRRVAYVFHFTEGWRGDWGGTTQFMRRNGSISETVVPTFNSLTLFTVPVLHYVSLVAPFAGTLRYSVTGWLHAPSA